MKNIINFQQFNNVNESLTSKIFYRGVTNSDNNFDETKLLGIWLSENIDTAQTYGSKITKYKLKKDLNLLEIWNTKSREFFNKYNYTEKEVTEPNQKFVESLKNEGYDGYYVLDYKNVFILDKKNLIKIS